MKTSKIIPTYKKESKDFLKKELIYSLQFRFRQKYSTTHAVIHLTDIIRNEIKEIMFVEYLQTSKKHFIL